MPRNATTDHVRIGGMISHMLAVRFFSAMGLVLVVALLHQVLVEWAVRQQDADTGAVELAGRQRTLAYRIEAALGEGHDQERDRLREDLAQWRSGQDALPLGHRIDALRLRWTPPFTRLAAAAEEAAAGGRRPDATARSGLAADAAAFAEAMDGLVREMGLRSEQRLDHLRWLLAGVFLVLALLLGFVDLFAFRPSINRARQALSDLEQVTRLAVEQEVAEAGGRLERRIGQDLHDGVGQRLTGAALMAKALSRRLAGRPEAEQAADIVHEINEAVAETRALSRQLFPAAADAEGLPPALRDLAATTARKAGVECTCDWEDDLPLPEVPPDEGTPAPMHLYRIAQEAVSNAIRHGQAKRIRIIGRREGPHGVMEVLDDGVGFAATAGAPTLGLGLRTMGYRAARLGAELKTGEEYAGSTVVRLRWRLEPGNPPFSLGK